MSEAAKSAALGPQYWSQRYQAQQTGWDIGEAARPFVEYFRDCPRHDLRILIPGAGHAYEAEHLHRQGFGQVTVLDLAAEPLERLQQRCPSFPAEHLVQGDFFEHTGTYDLILEQTFFCALPPTRRSDYVQHTHRLLAPEGRLVGLLFDIPLYQDHPPFGGHRSEYRPLFEPYFTLHGWETCRNSIPPRAGNELWINLQPKPMQG